MSEFSQNFMKWCAQKSSVFIETGTFKGTTTRLASKYFKKVYSIEINKENHDYSKKRLQNRNNITLILGDTVKEFPKLLKKECNSKITYWLDAHPMDPSIDKDCPLLVELDKIKELTNTNESIIIIDDLQRCYNSAGDYPKVEELTEKLLAINPNYQIKELPFKSWGVKKGKPSVLCASVEDFDFPPNFYVNPFSFLTKYLRVLGLAH